MIEMDRFLLQLPCLRNLELKTAIKPDVADGNRWQVLTSSLFTFYFKFGLSLENIQSTFKSFQTPFWLKEKRWFIAYHHRYLFSIPYFAPKEIDLSDRLIFHTTASDNSVIYQRVEKMTISGFTIDNKYHFPHIKTLVPNNFVTLKTLESIVDLTQVEHLTVRGLDDLLLFTSLKNQMPHLNELTVKEEVTGEMIRRIKSHQFDQIIKLTMSVSFMYHDYIREELVHVFPCIEHLTDHSLIYSEQTMIHSIDQFKHLFTVSFRRVSLYNHPEPSIVQNRSTRVQLSRRLTQRNFVCRIYRSLGNCFIYNWWIDVNI